MQTRCLLATLWSLAMNGAHASRIISNGTGQVSGDAATDSSADIAAAVNGVNLLRLVARPSEELRLRLSSVVSTPTGAEWPGRSSASSLSALLAEAQPHAVALLAVGGGGGGGGSPSPLARLLRAGTAAAEGGGQGAAPRVRAPGSRLDFHTRHILPSPPRPGPGVDDDLRRRAEPVAPSGLWPPPQRPQQQQAESRLAVAVANPTMPHGVEAGDGRARSKRGLQDAGVAAAGCTAAGATNYNASAVEDDGSCVWAALRVDGSCDYSYNGEYALQPDPVNGRPAWRKSSVGGSSDEYYFLHWSDQYGPQWRIDICASFDICTSDDLTSHPLGYIYADRSGAYLLG
jgi:hypothetical protein